MPYILNQQTIEELHSNLIMAFYPFYSYINIYLDYANKLYEYFIELCKSMNVSKVETGIFGADMKINYINDGPISIMLECSNGKIL